MSVMTSSNKYPLDALSVLRPAGQSAVDVATLSSALPIDVLSSYWAAGDITEPQYVCVEIVTESVSGSVSYTLEASTDSSFDSPVTVATTASITEPDRVSIVVEKASFNLFGGATTGFAGVLATPSSGGSVAFNIYISPAQKG